MTVTDISADRALKAKHRVLWGLGDYHAVASEVIPELGERIVATLEITRGERVLDVAAGSGNASVPAALRGATVVASDLTPSCSTPGAVRPSGPRSRSRGGGRRREAALRAGSFDVVMSTSA